MQNMAKAGSPVRVRENYQKITVKCVNYQNHTSTAAFKVLGRTVEKLRVSLPISPQSNPSSGGPKVCAYSGGPTVCAYSGGPTECGDSGGPTECGDAGCLCCFEASGRPGNPEAVKEDQTSFSFLASFSSCSP